MKPQVLSSLPDPNQDDGSNSKSTVETSDKPTVTQEDVIEVKKVKLKPSAVMTSAPKIPMS